MIRAVVVMAAMALSSAPAWAAQPPAKFDLVCKGEKRETAGAKTSTPYEVRYRIDLDAKRWCRGACAEAAQILSVTPDTITFADRKDADPSEPNNATHTISRTTGQLTDHSSVGRYPNNKFFDAKAQCDRAPFTGLPAAKF